MLKVSDIINALFKSIAYLILFFLVITGIIFLSKYAVSGSNYIPSLVCNNNNQHHMKIKQIISVEDSIAKFKMDDDSMENYIITRYAKDYRGHIVVYNTYIKVGDIICVSNK